MPNEIRTDITVLDKNTQNIEQKLYSCGFINKVKC